MTERESLLQEAKDLGLTFAKNAKTENIKKSVAVAKSEAAAEDAFENAGGIVEPTPAPITEAELRKQLEAEFTARLEDEKLKMTANLEVSMAQKSEDAGSNRVSIGQAKLKARRNALKLIRVNITCKDPSKNSWEGEIISAGNDVIGEAKKYIMFNTDDGYHIPQIIYNVLKEKKCTIFVNKKGKDGKMLKEARTINAYGLEVLPPLTEEEIDELSRDQISRRAVDAV